jgi:hypothetical protein
MAIRRFSGALVAALVTFCAPAADLSEELFAAARKGDSEAIKALLDKGADVNARWRYDTTALLMACMRGHAGAARLLLDRGAKADVKDTFYGMTPLSAATEKGLAEIVAMLIEKGAPGKDNALLGGVSGKHIEVVRAVLASGGLKPETLAEAVTTAASTGQTEVVDLLKKAGAVEGPKADATVDPALLQKYAGTYRTDSGTEFVFTFKDGKLSGGPGGQNLVLNAFDNVTFRPGQLYGVKLIFASEEGRVTGFTLDQRGSKQQFKRVEAK